MGSKGNNNQQKREERFNTHNRKAGHAKFWKHLSNRKGRRNGNRFRQWMTDGKINIQ